MKRPTEIFISTKIRSTTLSLAVFFMLLSPLAWETSSFAKAVSPTECEDVFDDVDAPAHSLEEFYRKSESRRSRPQRYGSKPSFDNAIDDTERLNNNFGEESPDLLAGFLPDNVHFIDHVLRDSNGRQVVKDPGSGFFVALRSDTKMGDQHILTNVGVSSLALVANETRAEKYLVRPEAKAAILSFHGGGTATSGFHVPINLMNHFASYDIDVVSIDWPWHGEGPRVRFNNDREMFQWLHAFIVQNIPDNVPVIVDGHSMGGLISDMINRLSDDPTFDLGNRIAGCISRSPVADPAPGQGLRAKFDAAHLINQARTHDPEVRSRFAPIEATLLDEMVGDGKLHPDGLEHELFLESFHSQKIPDHKGSEYKPMLVIVGRHDSLVFVGMEDQFRTNFTSLSNVSYHEMVEGETTTGGVEKVGHLIGDFLVNGEVEQFVVMRKWIQEKLNIELVKANPKGQQRRDTIASFLQLYSAQFAFREFVASNRIIYERTGTAAAGELTQQFVKFGQELERWKGYIKKRDKTFRANRDKDPAVRDALIDAIEKPEGFDELAAIEAKREEINQLRNMTYVPKNENEARTRENLARMKELSTHYGELNREMKALTDEGQKLAAKRKVLLEKQNKLNPTFIDDHVILASMRAESESLMHEIAEEDEKFAKYVANHFVTLMEENRFNAETQTQLPPEAIGHRNRVYALQNELVAKNDQLRALIKDTALEDGNAELHQVVKELMTIEHELNLAASRIAAMQSRFYMIEAERFTLIKEYVEVLVPGYYTLRQVTMREVMSQDTGSIASQMNYIDSILKDWRTLWNQRSPVSESGSAGKEGAY